MASMASMYLALCVAAFVLHAEAQNRYLPPGALVDVPTSSSPSWKMQPFKTEPDFVPEYFDIRLMTSNFSQLAPGYFFIDPGRFRTGDIFAGPQIYDIFGNLIYHAHDDTRSNDLHVCDFLGSTGDHMCLYHDKISMPERAYIMDETYTQVGISHTKKMDDDHDFNMLPGGRTMLKLWADHLPMDLTMYDGPKHGWVRDGCFVELDVETDEVVYEWCYLDHGLPIWATKLFPNFGHSRNETSRKVGTGLKHSQWDFCHANSVDKRDGDYILSCRHLDQIIKVAGPNNTHGVEPGTLIWRLGGNLGDFEMVGNFTFGRQHHIRYVSVTANETVISLFNNAWEGTNKPSSDACSGQIIRVNNVTMKAELVQNYAHPQGMVSEGRGSTQILPNNNVLVGFGTIPDAAEFASDGTLLYWVRHARTSVDLDPHIFDGSATGAIFSYRWNKSPWVGRPQWEPKVVAESSRCFHRSSSFTTWISWNGATEVQRWRIKTSTSRDGPWEVAGTFTKDGFETVVDLFHTLHSGKVPFVMVEALDSTGAVLNSALTRQTCHIALFPGIIGLIGLICLVEFADATGACLSRSGKSLPRVQTRKARVARACLPRRQTTPPAEKVYAD